MSPFFNTVPSGTIVSVSTVTSRLMTTFAPICALWPILHSFLIIVLSPMLTAFLIAQLLPIMKYN